MFRNMLVSVVLAALALVAGCAEKTIMAQPDLTDVLTKSVGITPAQAGIGTGSTLQYAKDSLPLGDYDKIFRSIPGADKYLAQAQDFLGSGGKISDFGGLKSTLSKAGMSEAQINKFLPQVTDYIGKYAGDASKKALGSILK